MARRSLAEQLAEAANPEPVDFDPEDFEAVGSQSESDSDIEEQNPQEHYIDVGRSKLRNDGIALSEGKYQGAPVSREELSESEESESEESEESEEEEVQNAAPQGNSVSQILNSEQKHLLSRLSEEKDGDAQKGKSVAAQMQVYEGLLDLRIQTQKLLTQTNKFSTGEPQSAAVMFPAIHAVQNLRRKIAGEAVETADEEPTLDQLMQSNRELDEELKRKRENVLTKWSRKVELSSGRNALQSNRFKSLGQSAVLQVNAVLTDMDRLVKRTKVDRSNYNLPESHEWLFDDSDFYRLLLKELVDRRMADSKAASGLKWKTAAAAVSKQKKNVDTKASKGRKLRFTVIEKIQGFDAPRNVFSWTEKQAEDLYSGLLGVKISMDETKDEKNEDEVEEVEVGDFNLFG